MQKNTQTTGHSLWAVQVAFPESTVEISPWQVLKLRYLVLNGLAQNMELKCKDILEK